MKNENIDVAESAEMMGKYSELKELFLEAKRKIKATTYYEKVTSFSSEIKEKYTINECFNTLLWHLIIGSTPPESAVNLDTPGGEIEDFIRNKIN